MVERTIIKKEIREQIKNNMSKVQFGDTKERIAREKEKADKTYLLYEDIMGIKCSEYFFHNDNRIYCYNAIFGQKFDSASFRVKNSVEETLLQIILNGWATFLKAGVKTLFLWLDRNIQKSDFTTEKVQITNNLISVKTISPAEYIIIEKEKCQNIGFLYPFPLSKLLKEIELKGLFSDDGIKVVNLKEFLDKFKK